MRRAFIHWEDSGARNQRPSQELYLCPEETGHYYRVLSWGVTQLELHIIKMAWLPCGKWAGGAGVEGVLVRMLLTRDDGSLSGG